jgi:putative peptidoglycan lipid II flippase
MFYSAGLFVFAGSRVLAFAFYSMKDTKLPVIVAACAMVANVVLSLLLMGPLRQGGLALASSLSSAINMVVLWIFLERKIGEFGLRPIAAAGMKICVLSVLMGVVVYVLALVCDHLTGTTTFFSRIIHVFIPISGGIIFYFGAASAMGLEEVAHISRLWKRDRRK